jgi:hypothetical protein
MLPLRATQRRDRGIALYPGVVGCVEATSPARWLQRIWDEVRIFVEICLRLAPIGAQTDRARESTRTRERMTSMIK